MCLILVAWRAHPDYPCVIAANRDEFHARSAEPAHWWSEENTARAPRAAKLPRILAGRDVLAGGTWLGVTRHGRFAALTNFRGAARRDDAPSRGALVLDMLRSDGSVIQLLDHLRDAGPAYTGFNVIFSDGRSLGVYESTVGTGRELAPGIYGLSNHLLDTPWPKVQNAKSALSRALTQLPDTAAALALLRDAQPAPQASAPRTGLSCDWDTLLSSAFIRAPDYGTRCSTVISIERDGAANFEEWTWDAAGAATGTASYRFKID